MAKHLRRNRRPNKKLCSLQGRASGKNLNYQIPKNETGKLKTLTEPGQKIPNNSSGKVNNKKLNSEYQLIIAVDKFSKWPTIKNCMLSETKEVFNFLNQNFNIHGLPKKMTTDKGGAFLSEEYKEFCKSRNFGIE